MNLEQLTELTQDQLRELRARADILLKSTGGHDPDEEMLHDVLVDTLTAHHHRAMPLHVARKAPHWGTFRENAAHILAFVRTHITENRVAMRKALGVLLRIQARWMLTRGIPLSHRTVCQQLVRIPDLVEREFPGYLESGLLSMIVRQR